MDHLRTDLVKKEEERRTIVIIFTRFTFLIEVWEQEPNQSASDEEVTI